MDAQVDSRVEQPAGGTVRLSTAARAWRAGLVALLCLLFAGGTWVGNDDWWPFGPWRMFATSTAPTGGIAVLAIESRSGAGASWPPASRNLSSVGLNRAEVEGRVPQMLGDPSMLGTLAATHSRLRPHDPRWTGVRVVRVVTVIVDRRPTGEQRRSVLAEWDAP